MKNKIIYTLFILGIIFCNAQTISLDALSICENGINCPDYNSVKDTNNRLNKFIGTWKGTYTDGRTYEFRFSKKLDFSLYGGKTWDRLIGKMLIKSSNGLILENSLNIPDGSTHFNGYYFDKNLVKYRLYYSGNADCNDKGYIFISFPNANNLTQMKLVFMQDMDIVSNCPARYKTVILDDKVLILTKQ